MKDAIKLVLYKLIYQLVKGVPAKAKPKHLMLVKTDEIGDYILIRNLLVYFRQSAVYRDYEITLVGNAIFRQIFEAYDAAVADNVIWLNKKDFSAKLFYRYRKLKEIRKSGASVIINLVYSRRFRFDDGIVGVTTASSRIGMQNSGHDVSKTEWRLTPKNIYTQLIGCGGEMLFDAYRNARFIEKILVLSVSSASTALVPKEDIAGFKLPPVYFVIFPGSGIKSKKWPSVCFAAVAKHVKHRYGFTPVVCGANGDKPDVEKFKLDFAEPVVDLTGKTTLPQLLGILRSASCLISVDTGSVHMAAAVRCPVFAVFSGLHYGRFAPYPEEIAPDFFAVYPGYVDGLIIEKSISGLEEIPVDLLKEIPPEKVIHKINDFFDFSLHPEYSAGN